MLKSLDRLDKLISHKIHQLVDMFIKDNRVANVLLTPFAVLFNKPLFIWIPVGSIFLLLG